MSRAIVLLSLCSSHALSGLGLAAAAPPKADPSPPAHRCDAPTQVEMNRCAADWHRDEDARLNRVYSQLVACPAGDSDRLRAAQRAWVAFRDAQCNWEAARYDGGSMQPLVRFSCLATLTEGRADELEGELNEIARHWVCPSHTG